MLIIDGASGEGGGQILRSALALSLISGKPFRIEHLRAGRDKPGLMQQHLTAVQAAAEIGQAEVDGAEIGSPRMEFRPSKVQSGEYHYDLETAGSTILVLQAILPGLLMGPGESRLTLEGGTHNPFAPPFEFLSRSYLPQINRMGPQVRTRLERPGFYPAGGGRMHVHVKPSDELAPIEITERTPVRRVVVRSVVAHLPNQIARRELARVRRKMPSLQAETAMEVTSETRGPGNVLFIEIETEDHTTIISAFGQRGIRAETVADQAVRNARRFLDSGAPIDDYLADQLLLPMALAGKGCFISPPLSPHARSNMHIITQFLGTRFEVEQETERTVRVRVRA